MDYTSHCYAYAQWLARSLPSEFSKGTEDDWLALDWGTLRKLADRCNTIRARIARGG